MSVLPSAMVASSASDTPDLDRATPGLAVRTVHEPSDDEPAVIIVVTGALESAGAPSLQSAWDAGVESFPAQVVLDLRRVDGCDATGLQVLAGISAACRARGMRLQLSARGRLDWLLLLAGLTEDVRTQPVVDHSPQDATATVR